MSEVDLFIAKKVLPRPKDKSFVQPRLVLDGRQWETTFLEGVPNHVLPVVPLWDIACGNYPYGKSFLIVHCSVHCIVAMF